MSLDIRYRTEYRYHGAVTDNMNTVRARPAQTRQQHVSEFSITVSPDARVTERTDYFGTVVHEFEVVAPHSALVIDVRSRVEMSEPPPPPAGVDWAALSERPYIEAGADYLSPHPEARPHETLTRIMQEVRGDDPLATAMLLTEVVPDTFEYRKGVTYVGSTVADLLEAGAGVCQDFVHLSLAVLRSFGMAARYCSGYLYAASDDETRSVEVETHAWMEVMLPGDGSSVTWVGVDPTNRGLVGERHVKIGHGRWYSDVAPVRGIYRGPVGADLTADVVMTQV